MDELTSILEQIKKYNKIIIHRHQRPDPDASTSQDLIGSVRWMKLKATSMTMLW